MPTPVILDTDVGTDIDDSWAIVQLLKSPGLDCRALVTAHGDTEARARIAAKLLEAAGRSDIPVGIGVPSPPDERSAVNMSLDDRAGEGGHQFGVPQVALRTLEAGLRGGQIGFGGTLGSQRRFVLTLRDGAALT